MDVSHVADSHLFLWTQLVSTMTRSGETLLHRVECIVEESEVYNYTFYTTNDNNINTNSYLSV